MAWKALSSPLRLPVPASEALTSGNWSPIRGSSGKLNWGRLQHAKQQIEDGERLLYERGTVNCVIVRHRSPQGIEPSCFKMAPWVEMSETENPPLNKRTQGAWRKLNREGTLCCLWLLEKVPESSGGLTYSCKIFVHHSLPPDQELERQRNTEWKKLLPVLKNTAFHQQQPGGEADKVWEQEYPVKVSVVPRLNAEAGRDTILASSEKRW